MNSWSCCDNDYEPRYPEDDKIRDMIKQATRLVLVLKRHGMSDLAIEEVVTDYLTPDR